MRDDSEPPDPFEPEPQSAALAGQWSRVNSTFQELDGMVVLVDQDESQGVISSTPASPYMFVVGDLKWRNILRAAAVEYAFEDLVRQSDTGSPSYVSGRIRISADGDSLSLSFPTTGTFQDWIQLN